MTQAGLAVPPGFVLSVSFFEPWFAAIEASSAWDAFASAGPDDLARACAALKVAGSGLSFCDEQRVAVDQALSDFPAKALFAVRSSSPEEDLEGSSFAGGYETVLGVTRATLSDAVRRAFLSCLDARVAIYKREHGFDPTRPSIAVVIQRQIASEVAGVGFSVNPIDNAYDDAVFSGNWGLGETVVAGIASPDTYVVDKVARTIRTREVGAKETSIWLGAEGGTTERRDPRHAELALRDDQVLMLTEEILKIEALYGKPMDIEWAFEGEQLHLLQARPITTVIPLPKEMITEPGAKKRLYLDATISVQGLLEPLSVMGTSILQALASAGYEQVAGMDLSRDIDASPIFALEGRLYVNLSILLHLIGKERYTKAYAIMDPVSASAIAALDEAEYAAETYAKKSAILGVLNNLPDKAFNVLEGRLLPAHARRGCEKNIERFAKRVLLLARTDASMVELARMAMKELAHLAFDQLIPLVVTARRAHGKIRELCEPIAGTSDAVEALDRSLPGNVTVEMGLALEGLADALRAAGVAPSASELAAGMRGEGLPSAFVEGWGAFLARYGHRGPGELDVASPRYREEPAMLLEQIAQLLRNDRPETAPGAVYERSRQARLRAFDELSGAVNAHHGWLQTKRYESLYRVLESLGGMRESGKFHMILIVDILRNMALERAKRLVEAGRLDRVEQIFALRIEDVDRVMGDAAVDVRALAAERSAFVRKLALCPRLPTLIDSRGRVIHPPRVEPKEGELAGQPVSVGVARGPVKVLAMPDEKPVEPGDILVARATDPGWTPLFVNAAAIVLEVGGLLQHGALVAREYGKPCVVGVERATERLSDGMMVEVDGAAGVVRLLQPVDFAGA